MDIKRCFSYILLTAALLSTACEKDVSRPPRKQVDLNGLTVEGQFPIVAWTGINASETSTKFIPMKKCGINTYLDWYDTYAEVKTALDNADKAGVKLIVKSKELEVDTEDVVTKMMNHPALFAYFIRDEPAVGDFEALGALVNNIQRQDPDHPCYINLYPNWAWGSIDGYLSKVSLFLRTVSARFLSFDHYPIKEEQGVSSLRPEWYKNLEDIRRISRAKNIPFWGFALALSHSLHAIVYPVPTIAELRLQQFSNLVYGAQGFQYFTYWGIYHDAPTIVYNRVKVINEELQALSKYFLGADVTGVWHTGSKIPYGTKVLSEMPTGIVSLSTSNVGAVVSQIEKNDATYIGIVNKDYQKSMELKIEFKGSALRIDREGDKTEAVSGTFSIEPGDLALFQIL